MSDACDPSRRGRRCNSERGPQHRPHALIVTEPRRARTAVARTARRNPHILVERPPTPTPDEEEYEAEQDRRRRETDHEERADDRARVVEEARVTARARVVERRRRPRAGRRQARSDRDRLDRGDLRHLERRGERDDLAGRVDRLDLLRRRHDLGGVRPID